MSECFGDHCVTCGDDGIQMRVLARPDRDGLATCSGEDGSEHFVETALVEPVAVGDKVLVHAGVALARLA